MVKYFIKQAIRHKGSLKKWARTKGFMHKDGTINLQKAKSYAKRHNLHHRLKQIYLAERLASFR